MPFSFWGSPASRTRTKESFSNDWWTNGPVQDWTGHENLVYPSASWNCRGEKEGVPHEFRGVWWSSRRIRRPASQQHVCVNGGRGGCLNCRSLGSDGSTRRWRCHVRSTVQERSRRSDAGGARPAKRPGVIPGSQTKNQWAAPTSRILALEISMEGLWSPWLSQRWPQRGQR